jgi:preprotein translocase subunit SecG
MSILIGIFTLILILVSLFLILIVLMQKSKDGGMGSALGGGATESAFGHETGNVLTKATINAAVLFFVLSFGLYLAQIYQSKHHASGSTGLPEITGPVAVPASGASTGPAAFPDFKLPATPTTSSAATTPAATSPVSAAAPGATPTSTTPPTVTLPPVEATSAKPADATKPANP